jgi:hypothetical protein
VFESGMGRIVYDVRGAVLSRCILGMKLKGYVACGNEPLARNSGKYEIEYSPPDRPPGDRRLGSFAKALRPTLSSEW